MQPGTPEKKVLPPAEKTSGIISPLPPRESPGSSPWPDPLPENLGRPGKNPVLSPPKILGRSHAKTAKKIYKKLPSWSLMKRETGTMSKL
jgi:hypothetical protein